MMKSIRKKVFASILAAVLLLMTASTVAFANPDRYQEQLEKYEEMQQRKITVKIQNCASYALKESKLYGRRVLGVGPMRIRRSIRSI